MAWCWNNTPAEMKVVKMSNGYMHIYINELHMYAYSYT